MVLEQYLRERGEKEGRRGKEWRDLPGNGLGS